MNLADRFASSVGDNSAPRATLREMENANDLTIATMTLQLMRDNRCTMPARAPVAAAYMSAALSCATARLRSPARAAGEAGPPDCNRDTWTRAE
ncbi:MAG TPA: hypothetical protein VEW25_13420 [Allosphingosinicella sp.]|nr:hypothetical protein [Allosphingosinicella sp.]